MRKHLFLAAYTALALLGLTAFLPQDAQALSGSQWQAGRIIDDSVFFNGNSMNAHDIQAFLNSMVPVCDTNGSQPYNSTMTRAQYGASRGYPAPYTCLKSYVQPTSAIAGDDLCAGYSGGTKSAAQIIHEVSVSCGINPRVLLVVLQKEQSLITDDWPWSMQYVKATGYGCPDSPLSTSVDGNQNGCADEYEGFFKQMYYGARTYKKYARDASSYRYRAGRVNFIQYHPNTACSGTDVFIQNQATANLYIYTPYQPNAAALSNLYGSGDIADPAPPNCSSFGNRNFWRMYNEWFGPTYGPLIRSLTSSTLYYTDGTERYIIPSMSMAAQYGLGLKDVRYMHQQEVNAIPLTNSPNTQYLAQLVKSDNDSDEDGATLYLVSNYKKFTVQSMTQLSAYGFNTGQISYMALPNLFRLPSGGLLQNYIQGSNQYVYKVEGGKKRVIFSPSTLKSINPSGAMSKISDFTAGTIRAGQPYVTGDAVLRGPDGKIWLYQESKWHYISSMSSYGCWKLSSLANINFVNYNQVEIAQAPGSLRCTVQRSDGSKYLMNSVNKINLQASWGFSGFSTPLDRTIDRLGSVSVGPSSVFKSPANASLYVLEGGKKRPIHSMDDFARMGYRSSNIVTVDGGLMTSIANGPLKIGSGFVLKKSDGTLYLINGNGKLRVPNMSVYAAYKLGNVKTVAANQELLNSYTDQGTLSIKFWAGGQALLADPNAKYVIPDGLKAHAGYTTPNSPAYSQWLTASLSGQKDLTRFIKASNSGAIYYLENGQKRPISSWAKLLQLGGSSSTIRTLSPVSMQLFPSGPTI